MKPLTETPGMPLDDQLTRHWLSNLRRPERLDGPVMRALLRAHGLDAAGSSLEVGRRAADLLRMAIEQLAPAAGATTSEGLPHRVLHACFVEGAKSYQVAPRLGVSERQLSRERARGISLLTAELRTARHGRHAGPAPPPADLLPRPDVVERLRALLETERHVHVCGPSGSGKTSLAALCAASSERPVFWMDVIPRLNAELWPVLFELGAHLEHEDASLAAYVRDAPAPPNLGLATRIALTALGHGDRLLVLDDYDAADPSVTIFLREAAARLPLLRIVTIGQAPLRGVACFRVPAFTGRETAELLAARGAGVADVSEGLRGWTRGNPRLTDLAARWLARGDAGGAVVDSIRADAHLLGTCTHSVARPFRDLPAARSRAAPRGGSR